jgi:hypothetical protein
MYCQNCGKQLSNETFCPECGTRVQDDSVAENFNYSVTDDGASIELWNKYNRTKILYILSFVATIFCLLAGVLMNSAIQDTKTTAKGISFKSGYVVNGEFHETNYGGTIAAHPELNKRVPLLTFFKYMFFVISAVSFIYGVILVISSAKLKREINYNNRR